MCQQAAAEIAAVVRHGVPSPDERHPTIAMSRSLAQTALTPADIVVPLAALQGALEALDPVVRTALEESIARLRATCEAERETDAVTCLTTTVDHAQRHEATLTHNATTFQHCGARLKPAARLRVHPSLISLLPRLKTSISGRHVE